jgi:YD repeat-containing protein
VVASNANATDSVVLDQAGRTTGAWQTVNGVTYQMSYSYDSHGRLVSRSALTGGNVTGSSFTLTYDPSLGQVDTIRALGTSAAYTFDAELKPIWTAYNGGAWWHTQTFDSLHQVTQDDFTPTQLHNDFAASWVYDSLGHLVSATTPTTGSLLPKHLKYDAAGQLIGACTGNNRYLCYDEYGGNATYYGQSYSYDGAGNRTDAAANGVIGAGNRLQQFKGYALTYDANGVCVL